MVRGDMPHQSGPIKKKMMPRFEILGQFTVLIWYNVEEKAGISFLYTWKVQSQNFKSGFKEKKKLYVNLYIYVSKNITTIQSKSVITI